ncbi:MAG: glycosyltransferase [Chloroflexi bacterium]|nr:glycosyltransferase [Chloroflexota bacterium]
MRTFLHVIHYPVFGGPQNQALRLASPLRERGWETVVVLPDEPGNAAERLRAAGIEVVTMPLHRLRAAPDVAIQARFLAGFVPEVRALQRLIRERAAQLVVVTGLTNSHAGIAARRERVPVTWQLVDTRPPMALRRVLMPLVVRLADSLMTTGREVARVHPGALAMGERLVTFFPPVDTGEFRPDAERRRTARAELGVPAEAFVVGAVGNLNPQKGHQYLLRAMARVQRRVPGAELRILGASTPTQIRYERELRREAKQLGIGEPGVVFRDPRTRVAELLPAFDVLALTAVPRSEGIPTVVLEAMACGVPVVATDAGAVREAIEQGVTGFVVRPLDVGAIAHALVRLAEQPGLRASMGVAGRARAEADFGLESCADAHVRAFEIAVARRAHTGR